MNKLKHFLKLAIHPLMNERGEVSIGDDEDKDGKEKKDTPSPAAIQELERKLKEAEDKAKEFENEKKGIYGDLKKERERNRQLEQSLDEKEKAISKGTEEDPLGDIADDDIITGKQLKKLNQAHTEKQRKTMVANFRFMADERVANDEDRVSTLCELRPDKYPVPYADAIKAFTELAENDPSLWQQYDAAKHRPGGKPAELAYKIALREHPKFKEQTEKTAREKLLEEMEEHEGKPKKLKGGSGGGSKRLEEMSDEEIGNLSDEDLERLSKPKK